MQVIGTTIYFDKDNNVIIIPTLKDEYGIGRDSMKFIKLQCGYSIKELGSFIIKSLKVSRINEPEDYEKYHVWTEASGIKSYSTFSKKYKMVLVNYRSDQDCYYVSKYKRFSNGAFGLNEEDIAKREKTYPGRPSVDTIGEQVLQALKIE